MTTFLYAPNAYLTYLAIVVWVAFILGCLLPLNIEDIS